MSKNVAADTSNISSAQATAGAGGASGSVTNSTSVAAEGASRAISMTSTLGGAIGAIASVVGTSIATAVIVVVVFISTLTIDLSLVMASVDSLVIQVEMQGAQDEDFESNIVAILEGNDGIYYEQKITPDNLVLTFKDLNADSEYFVIIKNDDKVFVEKSFVTAKIPEQKAIIEAYVENDIVYVEVKDVYLRSKEFYTLEAKDQIGNLLFVVDDDQPYNRFSFELNDAKDLLFTISVGGKVYVAYQLDTVTLPEYDFSEPIWNWSVDHNSAKVSFTEIHNGESLVLDATVSQQIVLEPTCEINGEKKYFAKAIFNDQEYSDSYSIVVSALGHEYGEPEFIWTPIYSEDPAPADEATPIGYTAIAKFICVHNSEHTMLLDALVTKELSDAVCEQDGSITYTATVSYNETKYKDVKVDLVSALGHVYGEPEFIWTPIYSGDALEPKEETPIAYTVIAKFTCIHNSAHFFELEADVSDEYNDATCEQDGSIVYTANVLYNDQLYSDTNVTVIPMYGHLYGEPEFEWTPIYSDDPISAPEYPIDYTVTATFTCLNNNEHTEVLDASVTKELILEATCEKEGLIEYTASVIFNEQVYYDTNEVVIPALDHDYGSPIFTWSPIYSGEIISEDETPLGYSATATFTCSRNNEHTLIWDVEVSYIDTEATCLDNAYRTYTATMEYNGQQYLDEYVYVFEETALDHDYSQYHEGSEVLPEFNWTENEDGTFSVSATFICSRDPSHCQILLPDITAINDYNCDLGGYIHYTATIIFNDNEYIDVKYVEVAPGHHYIPVFHWMMNGDTYDVEFCMVCEQNDGANTGSIHAEVTMEEMGEYRVFTASVRYNEVDYTEQKKVLKENHNKELMIGGEYFIGDTINIGETTTYFYDDYQGGAHRTNMSGSTTLIKSRVIGELGDDPLTYMDIADYDRLILDNPYYARMEDGEYGGYHGSSEETSWRFIHSDSLLIGVKIASGEGTLDSPYVLEPIYGVAVTFIANGGLYNTYDGYEVTKYYSGDDLENGVYVTPLDENPESSGMLFLGWYTEPSGHDKFDFDSTPVYDNLTLYAWWIKI